MAGPRAKRAAEIQDSIRHVLRHEWNPIGFDDQLPDDEYDSDIASIYRVLAGSRAEEELIDLLFRTERDSIGLPCTSPEQLRPVVRKLLTLDVSL